MRRSALVALPLLAALADPAPACPRPTPYEVILTPEATEIFDGGGIVIEARFGFGNPSDDGDASPGAPRLLDGAGQPVAFDRVVIAPYLSKLQPAPTRAARPLVLEQGKHTLRLRQVPGGKPPTAPSLARVTVAPPIGAPARGPYGPGPTTTVEIGAAPPADALALVLYVGGSARGWFRPQTGQIAYTYKAGGKQCQSPAGGMFIAASGEDVTAAWLDRQGRLSPRSKPVTARVP